MQLKSIFPSIVFVTASLTACVINPKPHYTFTPPAQPQLSFSGRGASAGPMFMDSMGPSGIAIGLAIDVGIGKQIEQFGFPKGVQLAQLLTQSIAKLPTGKVKQLFFSTSQQANIQVHKIGFVELPSYSNLIIPTVALNIQKGPWQSACKYPEDFITPNQSPLGASLDALKTAQSPAADLVQQALSHCISRSIDNWQKSGGVK